LRNEFIAGIGGLVIGHVLWLVAITFAMNTTTISTWVLVIAAVVLLIALVCGYVGWRHYQRRSYVWAAFLLMFPAAPLLFTLIVLGVTYL
jgi:hypothetical protein